MLQKEKRNSLHTTTQRKANCTGHILCRNGHLRQFIKGIKGKIGGTGKSERKVGTYWMTIRKQEDTGNLKGRLYIALPGKLAAKYAMDLSQGELIDGDNEILTMDTNFC
jgi:hypothetical protein